MGFSSLSQSSNNHNKIIAWLTGLLTLLLALFSFTLSFNALTGLATEHGVSIPVLFPLVVEAGVVIFSLNALYRSIQGESAKRQWWLIIGSSLLAGVFNVLHAEPDLVSRVMASMPSLFLLLSFETFLGQIKHSVTRANTIQSLAQLTDQLNTKRNELNALIDAKQSELSQLNREAEQLTKAIEQSKLTKSRLQEDIKQADLVQGNSLEQIKRTKAKRDAEAIEQRRGKLLNILTVQSELGVSALADRLNISRGTVYSDLKALSEAGQIYKNGKGWEVAQ